MSLFIKKVSYPRAAYYGRKNKNSVAHALHRGWKESENFDEKFFFFLRAGFIPLVLRCAAESLDANVIVPYIFQCKKMSIHRATHLEMDEEVLWLPSLKTEEFLQNLT